MNRKYSMFIVIAITLLYTGHALTTEDLQLAENGRNNVPITSISNTGAVNQPPSAKSLTPDIEGPQPTGTTIAWTGVAYDPDSDNMLYQFWLNGPSTGNKWKPMTDWGESNIWNWTTSPVDVGNNIVDLRIRDSHHSGPWGSDSHISAEYVIDSLVGAQGGSKLNRKPSILSLKSDRQSPQDKGVKVTWTAAASDPDDDTILYQYWLKGPSTEDQWVAVTGWTTSNSWLWNTGQTKAGIYTIEARIRDGYHTNIDNSDDSRRAVYVLKQTGIIE
ncbi:MAG: hypothetical protein ACE14P_06380 [Methanotrichaceae archaeon]